MGGINASSYDDGRPLCVALLTSIGAVAQVPPPDPANPNEAIPEASNLPPYGDTINIETAKKAAAGAIAEAHEAELEYIMRGGRQSVRRSGLFREAETIASTHRSRSRSTRPAPRRVIAAQRWCSNGCPEEGPFFAYLSTLDDVIMSRGGNPLVVGGKIIGAIGVSGGTGSQDDVVLAGRR